jgi:uncharacterized membrane protein
MSHIRRLAVGLCLAVALMLVGVVLTVARPDTEVPGGASFGDMLGDLAAFEPAGFLTLGLLVLLLTPVARVVALLIVFVRRSAWLFAGLALLVLGVIAVGAYLGLTA